MGDVIGILDSSGNTVVKYKYDAYVNCTCGASSNYDLADSNPIRYRSYYFDEETGLALVGKGLSIVDKMAGLTTAESIIFGTMTNSPLLGSGMAINMGIYKHASVYTVNDL